MNSLKLLVLPFVQCFCVPGGVLGYDDSTCGFQTCNPVKEGMLNVHLVPHTHDDVGWLKTVDQYYYAAREDIQRAGVCYIFDSVIPELLKDPTKRFIYVEIAFFWRWWNEQSDDMKAKVSQLVNEGRLEFTLGGWSMNDEAATHYNAIIDQHTLGLRFLNDTFGKCAHPRVAWQIDPFGHSRQQASLFAQMGYDALYFGRIDYQDKALRLKEKTMEMVWKGSPENTGSSSDLFSGTLFNGYGPPPGFCYDLLCADPPIMDDKRMHGYNVDYQVKAFLSAANDQSHHFTTNHIMMTMGSDFQYSNAHVWYKNLDKVIKYVNAEQINNSNVNVLYSTPSCYTYHVNQANQTYTTKDDDFFPYAIKPHGFLTGFYTSRPSMKGFVRDTNNALQIARQVHVIANLQNFTDSFSKLFQLEEAMGVAQHHDAISGTEKQAVADDYTDRLSRGNIAVADVINEGLMRLTNQTLNNNYRMSTSRRPCSVDKLQQRVTAWNPLTRPVKTYLRMVVFGSNWSVYGSGGALLAHDEMPSQTTEGIEVFIPAELPPLGLNVFLVGKNTERRREGDIKSLSIGQEDKVIGNAVTATVCTAPGGIHCLVLTMIDNMKAERRKHDRKPDSGARQIVKRNFGDLSKTARRTFVSIVFDGTTGRLKQMNNMKKKISISLQQEFQYYLSYQGGDRDQSSGAYIFRPNSSTPDVFPPQFFNTTYIQGKFVQEVRQFFSPWVSQTIRIYDDKPYVEIAWNVGPIPIDDKQGKEVINLFKTDLKNDGTFYTDANGREMMKRRLNHRDTWKFNNTEPVAGNYFPVNSRIYIQDKEKNTQLTVLTDRSQGGSSLHEGEMELMVHRRLLVDDRLGVGEPLNETGADGKGLIAHGAHYLLLDAIEEASTPHRLLGEELFMGPSMYISETTHTLESWLRESPQNKSFIQHQLPENVHLLTLQQIPNQRTQDTSFLILRLEHQFEVNEDPVLSQPVTVNLTSLFTQFDVINIEELTLAANMPLQDLNRLQWRTKVDNKPPRTEHHKANTPTGPVDPFCITLGPMDIRTFKLEIFYKQ